MTENEDTSFSILQQSLFHQIIQNEEPPAYTFYDPSKMLQHGFCLIYKSFKQFILKF